MPLLFLMLLALAQSAFAAEPDKNAELVAQLTAHTQEMFDALVSGNKDPWQKYFADDCIYADEKSHLFNKTQLINDIAPLPTGYGGTIKLGQIESRVLGDTVVLSYDINETETIFGQELHARYYITGHLAEAKQCLGDRCQPGAPSLRKPGTDRCPSVA